MASLRRYYATVEEDCEGETEDGMKQVSIGAPLDISNSDIDEETESAMKYLQSVKEQTKSLPFAIEAVIAPTVEFSSHDIDGITSIDSCSIPSKEFPGLVEATLEYFQSLREFTKKGRIICAGKEIEFVSGMSDTMVTGADFATIAGALEQLAGSLNELPPSVSLEYIWALLLHLEYPLLEDTAASLQILRRYCDDKSVSTDSDCYHARACSVIISHFFHQPS
jgi:hypothetical protein